MERADLGASGFVRMDGAPRRDEKASPARRDKLSRRVRQKWSRRDGSLTIDIRGVDPPMGVPPVSGYPARTSCTKEPRTPVSGAFARAGTRSVRVQGPRSKIIGSQS